MAKLAVILLVGGFPITPRKTALLETEHEDCA
jgi:hypothetical protein